MKRMVSWTISMLKYLLGILMMLNGVSTMLQEPIHSNHLQFIYDYRPTLVVFGAIVFATGAALFFGKLFKKQIIVGHSLFLLYCLYWFGFLSNWIALGWHDAWINGIMVMVVGALYLRWKYRFYYYNHPKKKVGATT